VDLLREGVISGAAAKRALDEAFDSGDPIEAIVLRLGLKQVSDTGELGEMVDVVIAQNPDVVEKFRGGNEGVLAFLVGQVMKASGGSANPKLAQEILRGRLSG
jgi:aspartyl-tRNA(Asn)/glutamyl-tRNA(Gln) amidotransferase subunit B